MFDSVLNTPLYKPTEMQACGQIFTLFLKRIIQKLKHSQHQFSY